MDNEKPHFGEYVGAQIKKKRKQKGWKQRELCEHFDVGKGMVSHWETGRYTPTYEQLYKLCDLFDCDVLELLPNRWEGQFK